MSVSATAILRHAQACVANQKLHEAFASFCQARDILSQDATVTSTSKRVLTQVHNEIERMGAYLKQDPYVCLGLTAATATDKSIKKAYRNMARTYHPDKNKHTQQLFILVKDAYEMLSNPIERAKFQRTSGSGSGSGGNTNSGSKSTKRSHPATKMSAEEAFRRRRQHEASEMAAKKRRHMEMKRKKEAAAKRRREAKNAEARKHREALLQQQMQDQIKKAWQFVHAQAEQDQGVSFHGNESSESGNSQSIGSKLDSIRQRVLEKMNEIRERAGGKTKESSREVYKNHTAEHVELGISALHGFRDDLQNQPKGVFRGVRRRFEDLVEGDV